MNFFFFFSKSSPIHYVNYEALPILSGFTMTENMLFCCRMCVLGKRLLKDIDISNCTKAVGSPLYNTFCNSSLASATCDPYFKQNNLTVVNGIKGLASGVFFGECYSYSVSIDFNKYLIC